MTGRRECANACGRDGALWCLGQLTCPLTCQLTGLPAAASFPLVLSPGSRAMQVRPRHSHCTVVEFLCFHPTTTSIMMVVLEVYYACPLGYTAGNDQCLNDCPSCGQMDELFVCTVWHCGIMSTCSNVSTAAFSSSFTRGPFLLTWIATDGQHRHAARAEEAAVRNQAVHPCIKCFLGDRKI
jgi:hypothetical protein